VSFDALLKKFPATILSCAHICPSDIIDTMFGSYLNPNRKGHVDVGGVVCDDSVQRLCHLDDLCEEYSVGGLLENILMIQNGWSGRGTPGISSNCGIDQPKSACSHSIVSPRYISHSNFERKCFRKNRFYSKMPRTNFDDALICQTLLPETSALPHFGVIPTSSPRRVGVASCQQETVWQSTLE
jgi:hypothetical protein